MSDRETVVRNKGLDDEYDVILWREPNGWFWRWDSAYAPDERDHGPYWNRRAALQGERMHGTGNCPRGRVQL